MGSLLVVEDDEGSRRLLTRLLEAHRPVRAACTAEDAITLIGAHDDWVGFFIDLHLGSQPRSGLHVLSAVRRVFPSVPAALVTGSNDRDVINRAATLSATYLCKPFGPEQIVAFLDRVSAADAELDERLANRMSALARRWNLAPRETEVLAWLLTGRSREAYLASHEGVTPLMWRGQVSRLLRKAGFSRTRDLVTEILHEEARALARRRA